MSRLTAADETHRSLLNCVLLDASERYLAREDHDDRESALSRYYLLMWKLEGYEGLAQPCPLTASDRRVIADALAEAVIYRSSRADDPAGAALAAGYAELARQLGVAPAVATAGTAGSGSWD